MTTVLEDLPLFRRTDPVTSRIAAGEAKSFRRGHHLAIINALRVAPGGASVIGDRCGLLAHQVGKRLNELAKTGQIVATGRLVESASGCREREWTVTAASL